MGRQENAASVALINGNRVLLVQRARLPHAGLWTLPGGRLEPGETLEECAVREVREELGLAVSRLQPVMRLVPGDSDFVLQCFATQTFEGTVAPSDEIMAWRWIALSALGDLATTPRLDEVLARAFGLFERG